MNTTIADSLQSALQSIANSAQLAKRSATDIRLLAVSKTKPNDMIEAAWQAGQRAFGENYVQEGLTKIGELAHLKNIEWHLIGPLQSNKCKPVAEHFDWVQSVDRLKIARRLNANRPDSLTPLNVCIQVNVSGEASKSGIAIKEAESLAEAIAQLPRLTLRGVMAIPSKTENNEQLSGEFHELHQLFTQLQQSYATVDTLSMGMTSDMPLAIACGSTMVRIGTAIFGARG